MRESRRAGESPYGPSRISWRACFANLRCARAASSPSASRDQEAKCDESATYIVTLVLGSDPLLDVHDPIDLVLDLGEHLRRVVISGVVRDRLGLASHGPIRRRGRRVVGHVIVLVGILELE